MTLRDKSVEELREELELINRTIRALEKLAHLRMESPATERSKSASAGRPRKTVKSSS